MQVWQAAAVAHCSIAPLALSGWWVLRSHWCLRLPALPCPALMYSFLLQVL